MISVTPVHALKSDYQYKVVIDAAALVENVGFYTLGSITDNHKVNQHYMSMFVKQGSSSAIVQHPLDSQRVWFSLF